MAGVTGTQVGFITTLFKAAEITSKTVANVETAIATATNEVTGVYDMGTLTKERDVIDIDIYGEDVAGKIPGQADPGTFDFTVTLDMGDTQHKALRDDTGLTKFTFVLVYTNGSAKTYAAFDGYIATADVEQSIDDVIKLNVSIARDQGITWLDKA